jgi:hypothetical protein
MDALARHPTAITPRHYVICPTAPSDPADPAAWPAPLATGTGRARPHSAAPGLAGERPLGAEGLQPDDPGFGKPGANTRTSPNRAAGSPGHP